MYRQQESVGQEKRTLALLLLAAGFGLWAILGPLPGMPVAHRWTSTQCLDAADVLAAQDRSRNGVSLTCHQDTLAREVSR